MIGTRFGIEAPATIGAQPDPLAASSAAPALAAAQSPSLWDRIGGELHKPGVAAALFRGGAETLRDGFGSGLQAMAGTMDQRHAQEVAAGQQQFENQLAMLRQAVAQQQADQTGRYQDGSLMNDAFRIDETGRHNRAGEQIDANGQRIQLHGIDTQAATAARGQTLDYNRGMAAIAQDDTNSQRSYDANIYGTNVGYLADGQRARAAGIGSKNGYTEQVTKTPAVKPRNGWFTDTPGSPEVTTTTRTPFAETSSAAPSQQAIAALKGNPALRGQFDAKYGAGSAAQFLGGR